MKNILAYILAVFLLVSAVAHQLSPEFYAAMIPDFIPVLLANILATVVEVVVGLALLLPKYRRTGGLLFALLMVAFLPIHGWDLFRDDPAIGPAPLPIIRFVFQFVLIFLGWWIYKGSQKNG